MLECGNAIPFGTNQLIIEEIKDNPASSLGKLILKPGKGTGAMTNHSSTTEITVRTGSAKVWMHRTTFELDVGGTLTIDKATPYNIEAEENGVEIGIEHWPPLDVESVSFEYGGQQIHSLKTGNYL